jgi:hypothetical protein
MAQTIIDSKYLDATRFAIARAFMMSWHGATGGRDSDETAKSQQLNLGCSQRFEMHQIIFQ